MNEEERLKRWENYPDIPNEVSESRRIIKDIADISVNFKCENQDGFFPEKCEEMMEEK